MCILDVIKHFTDILMYEEKTYKKIWENHLKENDRKPENPLYHFG